MIVIDYGMIWIDDIKSKSKKQKYHLTSSESFIRIHISKSE
jgi:hypothetical protein